MVRKRKNANKEKGQAENGDGKSTASASNAPVITFEAAPESPKNDSEKRLGGHDSLPKSPGKLSTWLGVGGSARKTYKSQNTVDIIAAKDLYNDVAPVIAAKLGKALVRQPDNFFDYFVYGFPGRKYAFAMSAALLFSCLNAWLLPQLLQVTDHTTAILLFSATCVCEVHHYLTEEVMLKWEENLLRYIAYRYISMPIVKDSIGPLGSVMDPMCVDSVEGYVGSLLRLVHSGEHVVEAIFLAVFLWNEQEFIGVDKELVPYAGPVLIIVTIVCCVAIAAYYWRNIGLQKEHVLQTRRVRYDFMWHRTQMNNLNDTSGYREHYSYHVGKVHNAIRSFFHAKHAHLRMLFVEEFIYHVLERVVIIAPVLVFGATLTQLYAASRFCRRLISLASTTHVTVRTIMVYQGKLAVFVDQQGKERLHDPVGDESPRHADQSVLHERVWAKWTNVDIGYQGNGEVHVVKSNISMVFRGSIFVSCTETGKTTLFRTLCGHLPALRGTAKLHKKERFHLVTGWCHVVEGGLLCNVSYPDCEKNAEREARAVDSLRRATLFEDKSVEWIKSRGTANLSSTELQKLALARVFYTEPRILFMDNATYLLSNEEIERVYDNLKETVTTLVSSGPERLRDYHHYTYSIANNHLEENVRKAK